MPPRRGFGGAHRGPGGQPPRGYAGRPAQYNGRPMGGPRWGHRPPRPHGCGCLISLLGIAALVIAGVVLLNVLLL